MDRNVMHQGYRGCDCNYNRVHSFSSLIILSMIVMLESRESLRKKKCTEVVKEFLLEKHQ